MTDKERLLELLASYRITPTLRPGEWNGESSAVELVKLKADEGGVEGYQGFYCQFIFRSEDGSFAEVGVWE